MVPAALWTTGGEADGVPIRWGYGVRSTSGPLVEKRVIMCCASKSACLASLLDLDGDAAASVRRRFAFLSSAGASWYPEPGQMRPAPTAATVAGEQVGTSSKLPSKRSRSARSFANLASFCSRRRASTYNASSSASCSGVREKSFCTARFRSVSCCLS